MTQALTFPSSQFAALKTEDAPAALLKVIKDNDVTARNLTKIGTPSGKSKLFEIETVDGTKAEAKLHLVVLNVFARQKAWWAKDSNESSNTPPDCRSTDGFHGVGNNRLDQHPDGNATLAKAHDCLTCPMNAWASDRKGGKGKDCKDFALITALRKGTRLPVLLKVPTTSLDAMKGYLLRLGDTEDELSSTDVVTEIALTPRKGGATGSIDYHSITFTSVGRLPESEAKGAKWLAEKLANVVTPISFEIESAELRGDGKTDDPATAGKSAERPVHTQAVRDIDVTNSSAQVS